MHCPICNAFTKVIITCNDASHVYRKRECLNAGHRFVTKEEIVEEPFPYKLKREGYDIPIVKKEEYKHGKSKSH